MSGRKTFVWTAAGLSLILGLLACNISVNGVAPTPATGLPSNTPLVSVRPLATDTTQAETQTATQAAPTESSTPVPATYTPGVSTTPTPQNPLVTITAYCWSGPTGKTLKYELVSSIQAGTRVQLLGKGIVDGWWVVRNPRYNDPCWIQQEYVQIDPGYDLSTLKTFAIPWTPTPTP
ncbi:MAG: hypothetical protein WAN58_14220 [Anaerolineales bacterium]